MAKIEEMRLASLRNNESFDHMKLTNDELDLLPADPEEGTSIITEPRESFKTEFKEFDRVMRLSDMKDITAQVVACDDARDEAWRNAFKYTEIMCSHPDETTRGYAQMLMKDFERNGNPLELSQSEETTVLYNLLQDVMPYSEHIIRQSFNLGPWLDVLEEAQTAFEEANKRRAEARGALEIGAVKAARAATEAAYTRLIDVVNAAAIIHGEAAYKNFIEAMNGQIARAKAIVKARRTRSANEKEETPAPETGEEANV